MTLKTVKPKAYVGNFTIRIGPIQMVGKMFPIRKPKESTGFKLCTPDGRQVQQVYTPTDGSDEVFTYSELERGVLDDDGVMKLVGQENIAEAKTSDLPNNVINVTVHDSTELDGMLWPSDDNAYLFEPNSADPTNVQWHEVLLALLNKGNKAYVGMCKFHNHDGFYRLTVWRDRIVMQKQLFPEALHDHSKYPAEVKVQAAITKKAASVMDKITEPFDPSLYADQQTSRVKQLIESAAEGTVQPVAKKKVAASDVDIASILDSFIED